MPKFNCVIREEVLCSIEITIDASTKEEAAQIARDAWVINGEGDKRESVEERDVFIDNEWIETND